RDSVGRAGRPWGRREFLHSCGGLAIAGSLTTGLAEGKGPGSGIGRQDLGARSCILVYLLGGPPHLDMWDLKPDAPAEVRGPFRPIPTSVPGLRVCEHLPRLAALAHRYALVRSVSHNNHNHTPMIYYTLTGRPVERRATLLSVLESRTPELRGARGYGELRRQAVALTGASGGGPPAFSLDGEPTRVQERYGRHRFGRALLLARRLAEAGVPMTA